MVGDGVSKNKVESGPWPGTSMNKKTTPSPAGAAPVWFKVFGRTAMVQAVQPGMRRHRRGCILNLSSLAGIRGMPALGPYNATQLRQAFTAGEAVARCAEFPKDAS